MFSFKKYPTGARYYFIGHEKKRVPEIDNKSLVFDITKRRSGKYKNKEFQIEKGYIIYDNKKMELTRNVKELILVYSDPTTELRPTYIVILDKNLSPGEYLKLIISMADTISNLVGVDFE